MSDYLSIGSLLLGLLAWALPVIRIKRGAQSKWKRNQAFLIGSFSACALALWLQLAEVRHRAGIGDWSAIGDTSGAVMGVSFVLIAVTVLLNVIASADQDS